MSETVYVLGAGFSKDGGAPTQKGDTSTVILN